MMDDDIQFENLKAIAKSLHDNLNMTELTLLSFNDELKKLLVKQALTKTSPETIAQLVKYLIDAQADYARCKTTIGMLLALILP